MRIGIALPTLASGDAVGHDVLGMTHVLRKKGYDVEFFAWTNATEEPVHLLDEIPKILKSQDDVLIYHHSIGCEPAVKAMERLPCRRKAVKYHNITPPEFFAKTNPKVAQGCTEGLQQIPRLAKVAKAVWADSAYNAQDFTARDSTLRVSELPPFHQADELFAIEPDYRAVAGLDDWNTNILLVGRVVPNKDVLLAVRAFAEYRRKYNPRARFVVAGGWPLPDHANEVLKLIRTLGQEGHAIVTGGVSVAQLKALYLTADVLLVTSKHEGFCVPLVEAMGLRLPVVAVPNAAVPFTAGEAARYADPDPVMIAAEVDAVLTDPVAREAQILAGWTRYETQFTNASIERRFEKLFEELLAD
ncbi:MAG: glycosyltransferase [Bacteroidales bacterium]|nr:glycosyltransferase [Bacteroidales bacterium]